MNNFIYPEKFIQSFFDFVDERIFSNFSFLFFLNFFKNYSKIFSFENISYIWTNGHNFFPPFDKFHIQFFYDREGTGKITRREDDPFLAR